MDNTILPHVESITPANLSLVQKLSKIRAMSDVAVRSKNGYNYSYTDVTEILANVTAGMEKYRVSLIPVIVPGTSRINQTTIINTKIDKQGKTFDKKETEMLFTAEMVFKWVNDDNPTDTIEVPWFTTGSMPDCSQAVGSSLSYTLRYFLITFFQIAQSTNDVDDYRSKKKAVEKAEEKAVLEAIIEQIDLSVKTYLSDHQDKKDTIKSFLSKYIKNANYLAIKEPSLAAKLLADFKKQFVNEESVTE